MPLITSSATPNPLITLYTSSLSVGAPAFFQAVINFSAVTFVVTCFAAPAIPAPVAFAPLAIAPPAAFAPLAIAPPAACAPFLIAPPAFLRTSIGPSSSSCLL